MNTQKYFSNATTYYYYLICAKITTVCANDFPKKNYEHIYNNLMI